MSARSHRPSPPARAVVAAVIAVVLAACGGSGEGSSAPTDGPTTAVATVDATAPVDRDNAALADRCAPEVFRAARPRAVGLPTGEGFDLFAAEVGSGSRGVVLVHGIGDSGLCRWASVAAWLAADGFHVLALDSRCDGWSDCPEEAGEALDRDVPAAVAHLREAGASTVAVVGESAGGGVALAAAAHPDAGIDALVVVSGAYFDGSYTGPVPVPLPALARRIAAPTLYLSTRNDNVVDQAAYRSWARATPRSSYSVWDEGSHGATLFGYDDVRDRRYRDPFVAFLRDPASAS